ncbi:MAG: DeoR/GlpR transcriptional regulator [Erysipelotrichaceae bacterium]|nr:DeoR/GlpR transcriptional regulator [Erysipelotrichaceae bacterium]
MKTERREYILDKIRIDKKIKAQDIVQQFDVTMETVRRDLEELENQGLLRRVYGGAIEGRIFEPEPSYDSRIISRLDEKQAIAHNTAELINDGEFVYLDGGTTVLEVATELANSGKALTVVTNALPIAEALLHGENIEVIVLGGFVSKGESVINRLQDPTIINVFNFQKTILGAASISPSQGVTDYNLDVSMLKKRIMEKSDKVIFVADHSKFNKRVRYTVADYHDIDVIVTDKKTSPEDIETCKKAGIEVIVCE